MVGPEVSSGRSVELPLVVLPISIPSPLAQDFKRPLMTLEDEMRGCFGTEGEEDLLFSGSELTAGAVSSILRDSDLMRADALSIEDVLASSFQGAATVRSNAFICLIFDFNLPLPLSCSVKWLPM